MISTCYSALKSSASSSASALGMIATVHGAQEIAEGNLQNGLCTAAMGMTAINIGQMGQGEEFTKASTIGGMAAVAVKGCYNIRDGIKDRSLRTTLKGATQLAVGAAGTVLISALPSKIVSFATQTLTLAGISSLVAMSGVKDIANGQYLKGAAKTALGATGVLASGLCALGVMADPAELYDIDEMSPDNIPIPRIVGKSVVRREALSINLPCEECGMFCIFQSVLALANAYNPKIHAGLEVNFRKEGLNYDPEKGENWFNYYFEPVNIGNLAGKRIVPFTRSEFGTAGNYLEGNIGSAKGTPGMSRENVNRLINKYLKLKPRVQKQIDKFVQNNFEGNYVIGVHYRGTDKVRPPYSEADRVPYESIIESVKQHAKEKNQEQFKIFIASDEQAFVDRMKQEFPGQVLVTSTERSTNDQALHFRGKNQYKMGKGAVKDAWLLSRTNFLVRTSSNLSLFSTYLNPNLPVLEVSRRTRYV